jgi:hypothetical protein
MSAQWLQEWFPVVGMMLQVLLWGQIVPRIASPKTLAILTFQPLPGDPKW